ncbi:MAG: hypothetical protein WCJ58_07740 [bacterium]
MASNLQFTIILKAIIVSDGKILILQSDSENNWTIPGGRLDLDEADYESVNVIQQKLQQIVVAQTGVDIKMNVALITSKLQKNAELVLIFLAEAKVESVFSSEARWISSFEIGKYQFAENIAAYLAQGFAMVPFLVRRIAKHKM